MCAWLEIQSVFIPRNLTQCAALLAGDHVPGEPLDLNFKFVFTSVASLNLVEDRKHFPVLSFTLYRL